MEERRGKASTARFSKPGRLKFDGNGVDCTIRNISPIGRRSTWRARLAFRTKITLNILSRHERQNCQIVCARKSGLAWPFAY